MYTIESSSGVITIDETGKVISQETSDDCSKVVKFDLDEYKSVWGVDTVPAVIDILDIRGILENGKELVWTDYKAKRLLRIIELQEQLSKFSEYL